MRQMIGGTSLAWNGSKDVMGELLITQTLDQKQWQLRDSFWCRTAACRSSPGSCTTHPDLIDASSLAGCRKISVRNGESPIGQNGRRVAEPSPILLRTITSLAGIMRWTDNK